MHRKISFRKKVAKMVPKRVFLTLSEIGQFGATIVHFKCQIGNSKVALFQKCSTTKGKVPGNAFLDMSIIWTIFRWQLGDLWYHIHKFWTYHITLSHGNGCWENISERWRLLGGGGFPVFLGVDTQISHKNTNYQKKTKIAQIGPIHIVSF